jgi:ABC-type polysaccharide/polyol phosphate transport system ATPase subunit
MTIEQIQTAIAKGKNVSFSNHNEGRKVTFFKVSHGIITIQAGNVRRFKESALDYFLNRVVIA